MATTSKATQPKEKAQIVPIKRRSEAGTVRLSTHYTTDVFSRLTKFSRDKGLFNEQDVIRLAVAAFLEKAGY